VIYVGDELLIKALVGSGVDLSSLSRFKVVSSESPHGVYVYDRVRGEWVLTLISGNAFKPPIDGYYIIYFDNSKCSACRAYDGTWFKYVEEVAKRLTNHYFIVILCEWFSRKCNSEAASNSFKEYDIHASPTTYLLYFRDGKVVYREKYEGRLNSNELIKIVEEFSLRVEKFLRGEKVELPKKEEEVDITEVIKKLIEIISEASKSRRS
jgi:thiol-disulfide isomerase/thioredoxin